ncbi:MAG: hypothetical protein II453_16490 [Alphaproteobacteria bacterium]|nr:hypothetical protein [Alphaproteobacteria bacterium]
MDMEQNLENQNQEGQEQQPQQPVDVDSTNEGVKETDTTVNPETNLEEWQKDSRYGKMWNKADDLYNSYKSLETKFQDVNPKYTGLLKILKENGFQAETLADELKKYADYRNPESRINQVYNYVDKLLNNNLYSDRVLQFFNQIEAEELQRLYPNMSAEQIKKQQELEAKLQQLETTERQRQEEKYMADTTAQIANGLTECDNLAKEYGFKMTDEVKNYLLTYCRDNNIEPRYIKSVFRELYGKQLLEARDKKILANYSARKQKIKDAEIISGGAGKVGNFAPTGDAKSKLKATFERILGK